MSSTRPITTLPKNVEPVFKVLRNKIRNLSQNNISTATKELVASFIGLVIPKVSKELTRVYKRARNTIASREGKKLPFTEENQQDINNYVNSKLLWQSYANLSDDLSKKINKILSSHFKENQFNYSEAKKELLKEIPKLSEVRVNRIIRTEYANIQRMSMEKTYRELDPENKWKYKWLSIPDNRRTKYCYNISKRTANGVSLDELKRIIREEADPKIYTPERPFLVHIGCRSSYIKVR